AQDFTQRTRSFLFGTLAFVVAHIFRKKEITFYENGIVSLNLPLARHVLGTRATRTTHPKALADFGSLFSLVAEEPIKVLNPFFWKTKAELVSMLAVEGMADLIRRSFSCSRVRTATVTGKHCGVCSQCLERRFALFSAGLEREEPEETYKVPSGMWLELARRDLRD